MRNCRYIFIILSFLFLGCKEKDAQKKEYYENGMLKKISITRKGAKSPSIEYYFYNNGQIKQIVRSDSNHLQGEQLWFTNAGFLDRKLKKINGTTEGNAYYFFDSTGALKHFRHFQNGMETLYGCDFWGDPIDQMKASLHFNDSGQIFFKKNFDINGNLISEEGKRE